MGDERAEEFRDFFASAEPVLRRAMVAAYGPLGRDASADALAYAWEHWDRVGNMDNLIGYLYRVAQSRMRWYRRRPPLVASPEAPREPWYEPGLAAALAELTRAQRVAVVLCHGFGLTYRATAEFLELSPSTGAQLVVLTSCEGEVILRGARSNAQPATLPSTGPQWRRGEHPRILEHEPFRARSAGAGTTESRYAGEAHMPEDKDFKRVVRARMDATGENYTQARSSLRPADPSETRAEREPGEAPSAPLDAPTTDAYRTLMATATFEDIQGAQILGLAPDKIAAYLDVLPGLSLEEIEGAHVLGLAPKKMAGYLGVMPALSLEDMEGAHVLGLAPEAIAGYLAVLPDLSLEDVQGAGALGLSAPALASYLSGTADTVDPGVARFVAALDPDSRVGTTRLDEIGVDRPLNQWVRDRLRGLDVDAVHAIPLDGPWSPELLLAVAEAGAARVRDEIVLLGLDGPATDEILFDVVRALEAAR